MLMAVFLFFVYVCGYCCACVCVDFVCNFSGSKNFLVYWEAVCHKAGVSLLVELRLLEQKKSDFH